MRLADERRGSRQKRGYTDRWAKYSRQFRRAHPLCADPFQVHGELGAFTEVTDHIVPPWAGGSFWHPGNHQPLCQSCNKRKAAADRSRYAKVRAGATGAASAAPGELLVLSSLTGAGAGDA
jgi:5-methylcytosine-specific restriction endonuclease McrA